MQLHRAGMITGLVQETGGVMAYSMPSGQLSKLSPDLLSKPEIFPA